MSTLSRSVCLLACYVVIGCWACGSLWAGDGEATEVDVVRVRRSTLSRIATQPATVHPYYRARIYARASGYVNQLPVDIGQSVKRGDLLAVLDIPELVRQREAQQATVRQMEAEERQAASQVVVAKAKSTSSEAKHKKAIAEVEKANAELVALRVEMERVAELVQQRAIADRLLDEARKRHDAALAQKVAAEAGVASAAADMGLAVAQVTAAEADVDVAKAMTQVARCKAEELDELIGYARVTAPFDGMITERNVELGDLVGGTSGAGGQERGPLFVVAQLDRVRVRVPVPERDAPYADVGDSAAVTFQALTGQVFTGAVSRIAGELAAQTRTMLVEIDLPNTEGKLRPGMFGQARITLVEPRETWMLPVGAIRYDESGKSCVYVVNDKDEIQVIEVKTGLDNGELIEIVSGLDGTERVAGPSLQRLRSGQTVTVKN